jgi:hypothetical protein
MPQDHGSHTRPDPPDDTDDQAMAETFDETHLDNDDGEDIANFDEMPDVFDTTSAEGDEDEDEFDDDESDAALADMRDEAGDDDDEQRPLETRLETEPDSATSVADVEEEDQESDAVRASPDDVDADTPILDDEAVTTEDRNKPNRFESNRELSNEELRRLGYRRR